MSARRCTRLALGLWLAVGAGAMGAAATGQAQTWSITPQAHAETPPFDGHTAPQAVEVPEQHPTFAPSTLASACIGKPNALGVSRVVEIDTTSGPRFGEQYTRDEAHFLEPGEVVLTFDDGPMRRYTIPILDALDEHCAKATFFSVGRMAVSDPATLQETARRGHTIALHTWSHKNLATLSAPAMKREVELGLSAVAAAAGTPIAPFFRFPYLGHSKSSLAYIQSRGMGIFGIHVDSSDFRTRNPGVVLRNVMSKLARTKKGILLFHDIQPSTAGAIGSLLDELKAEGYKIVHIVAKHPPVTLPEFDAIAEKSLRGKMSKAAQQPIAERAATWPVSEGGEAAPVATPAPPPTATPQRPSASPRPYDWANPSNDPWQLRSFGND